MLTKGMSKDISLVSLYQSIDTFVMQWNIAKEGVNETLIRQ